jgi:hypothetical protein
VRCLSEYRFENRIVFASHCFLMRMGIHQSFGATVKLLKPSFRSGAHKTPGYCWSTSFKVLGVLLLGKVSSVFCLQKRHLGHTNFGTGGWPTVSARFLYNFTAPRFGVTLPPASLRLLNGHFCAITIAKSIPKIPRHDSCFCNAPVLY